MQKASQSAQFIDNSIPELQLIQEIKKRFFSINKTRLQRTYSALTERQQQFLQVLPLLFHINHPSLPAYVSNQTPSGIDQYHPELEITQLVQQLFSRNFKYVKIRNKPQLASIYLMGSTGTIAQSDKSDLDIWLCHIQPFTKKQEELLQKKTLLLKDWAESSGLEVHFFLMNPQRFQKGEPAILTAENCGTAQHFMLLDEFYRTSVLLAGRYPMWWLVPPQVENYHAYTKKLINHIFIRQSEAVDFGDARHFPAGEFIGAGMWQMYKAIHSPHKALLKLLLIEIYAIEYPHIQTLSQNYKQEVYQGKLMIDELDPYVLFYRKLENYLTTYQEIDRLELIRRSLYLKLNISLGIQQSKKRDNWRRELLIKLVKQWRWSQSHLYSLDTHTQWKAHRVIREQSGLVSELLHIYRFLSQFAREHGEDIQINSRDMSILGRKLYSAFEKKAGKVNFINPNISDDISEEILSFQEISLKSTGNIDSAWRAFNTGISPKQKRSEPPLKRTRSIIELICWCHINSILTTNTHIYLETLHSKLSIMDCNNIINSLQEILPTPVKESDSIDFNIGAHPLKIILFANIGINILPRTEKKSPYELTSRPVLPTTIHPNDNLAVTLDQITYTSWHEVICHHYKDRHAIIRCLQNFFQLVPLSSTPSIPKLYIKCFSTGNGAAIEKRIQTLYNDIISCFYQPYSISSTRFILELKTWFYIIQFTSNKPRIQIAHNRDKLLQLLAAPQQQYSPILLDRFSLKNTALETIATIMKSHSIQVFYEIVNNKAHLYISDEKGSLFHYSNHFYKQKNLLVPLHRFIQSCLNRQNKENFLIDDFHDHQDILFYEIVKQPVNISPNAAPRNINSNEQATRYINIQAIAEENTSKKIQFTIYCEQQEFSELEYGNRLFPAIASHINSIRSEQQYYPCHITDMDLSRCHSLFADYHNIQLTQYLHYKCLLESMINQALQNIKNKTGNTP